MPKKTLILLLTCFLSVIHAQDVLPTNYFNEVRLRLENNTFTSTSNSLFLDGSKYLHFQFEDQQAVAEVEIIPNPLLDFQNIELLPSGDFEVIDSLLLINESRYRFKVQFKNLIKSRFLQFTFRIQSKAEEPPFIQELKLLPTTSTKAFIAPKDNGLFIGEERTFKVETNRPDNIVFPKEWTQGKNINYKFSGRQGDLILHVLPTRGGVRNLKIPLKVKVPRLDSISNRLVYQLPKIEYRFDVKQSKLIFLNTNRKDITLNEKNRQTGVEIELEYHPNLKLKKTYRLEQQEEAGGALIAEVFTRNVLANGRIICWLRAYNLHKQADGYLYIKDGDQPKFFTNFNISPKTQVNEIRVVGKKGNYSNGNNVYPGETVEIKIRGIGLNKAQFTFEGLENVVSDSLTSNENVQSFLFKVPMNINKSEIEIFNYGRPLGRTLKVQEFQVAHPMDFVKILMEDEEPITLAEANQVIFVENTISNIVVGFDREGIDTKKRLYGKQYLNIEVVITDKNNRLLDRKMIPNIIVCPGENSPRFNYYDTKNCRFENISLNQYLRQKTFNLEGWSRVEIIVQHDRTKHGGQGFYKKAEIILRQNYSFNLDVSFPAGLVTKTVGEEGFGTLSGVSMAIIAQFSFYKPKKINKIRPYKFGAGFLAFNAFNFAENASNRDVGVVALASLYPVSTGQRSRLSFPLFLGGGYFLSESKFFYLIGPGIRLRI
ncbi:MAG: hypothetical protein AAF573_12325 [Bacteroidota bacterium]